jgi:hypothetical protein
MTEIMKDGKTQLVAVQTVEIPAGTLERSFILVDRRSCDGLVKSGV